MLDINPAEWPELNRLLDEALDRPPAERAGWLEALGPQFDTLKPRLRDLLGRAATVETGEFLHTLPKLEIGADADAADAHQAGARIGPYCLLRPLGMGGMGSVWLAERADAQVKVPVALKLPHGHLMRPGLAERMAREREILATLDHPKIAKLLDAGLTSDGQPYLALEFVAGRNIDAHCRGGEGRAPLELRPRLRLFLQVAEAVAYAHNKLVLHRDLKPANVLVTYDSQVRLLDFGIAKLLDEGEVRETRLTALSGRALTLDYASPEQILGEPMTVASDVYSLGVLLYELLTGARPYQIKRGTRAAIEEAILTAEPQRPSALALRKELRGDLDTIVLKALKKTAAERYGTVQAFADDVKRWLDNRPVLAQPDSLGYRVRKFVRRNRAVVGAAAAISLAIVIGAGAAVWQMLEAREQRDTAVLHQRRAEAFSQFMGVILHDAGGGATALTPTELLDRGVAMLENQRGMDASVTAFMWYEVARSYRLFSQTDRERAMLERGAQGARSIGDLNLLAASECALAWSLLERDRTGALAQFATAQRALAAVPDAADYARLECLHTEARLMQMNGEVTGAIALIEASRETFATMRQRQGWHYALMMDQLAGLYRAVERNKDSLAIASEQLQKLRDNGRAGSLAEMMLMSNFARDLCRVGEYLECAAVHAEVLQRATRANMPRLPAVGIRFRAGVAAYDLGQYERALELANAELEVAGASGNRAALANGRMLAANALLELGRFEESAASMLEAERIWNVNAGAFAPYLREAAQYHIELTLARGDVAAAQRAMQGLLARMGYPGRPDAVRSDRLLRLAARVALAARDAPQAELLAGAALALAQRNARGDASSADVGLAALLRARARQQLGHGREARTDAELAARSLRNGAGAAHADTLQATALLASLAPLP